MKILQLVQKPQRRGAEIFAFQLSQELRRRGHQVRAIYLYPHHEANSLPLQAEDCLLAGRENHPLEKLPGFQPGLVRALRQQMAEFRPEVVQVNGARTVKYGALARYFNKMEPWILVYRNIGNPSDWVRGWPYRLFYSRVVMPKLSGIVGVSQTTLQNLKGFYDLSIPMVYIPNGVDPSTLETTITREQFRRKMQVSDRTPVILFVGSLTPEKRLDRLLRLAGHSLVHLADLQVWVVGNGPLRAELEAQAESLGLQNVVRFWGGQSKVAAYIQAADLLLLPSDTEGIPAVILEAGLVGLPVVATQVGGLAECVLDQETGILVDPADEANLAEVVLALLQDPPRRAKLGENAQSWIRQNFTIDKIGQKYLDFYQTLLIN